MIKMIENLKNEVIRNQYFNKVNLRKHKGGELLQFLFVIAIGASMYLVLSGKGDKLIADLWTWVETMVKGVTK
ncbi:hypothetical protein [Clostridium hydrogeniformans]|uniref:hypothetical protein n=1 Tax=Clostridium hydrogeniformans TaxID=349933 RepID=UPI0004869455|nr:hypothetical protein [Clostridium hydrogeniformans]